MIPHPLCLLRALWRSLLTGQLFSGHDFTTAAEKTPPNVHVLRCRTCGSQSIGWSWSSLEAEK